MSKFSSASVKLLVDGIDLTPLLTESISHSNEGVTEQSNPFGSVAEGHDPVGMTKGSLVVGGGYFDEAVDLLHAGLADSGLSDTPAATSRVVNVFVEGQTAGNHCTGYEGVYSQKYEVLDSNGKLTRANVGYQVTGKADEQAVILAPLAAITADGDTHLTPYDAADDSTAERHPITGASVEAGATSIITCPDDHNLTSGDVIAIFDMAGGITPDINDSGAGAWQYVGHTVTVINATSFSIPVDVTNDGTGGYFVVVSQPTGGAGYLQVTAGSGVTNYVGKIKHSVDGTVWVDLVTFADTTTDYSTAQRVATATPTTQVRRYLAVYDDVTGAGSLTRFMGFGRG